MKRMTSSIAMFSVLFLLVGNVSAASFLEDEAGISASIQLASANLELAETAFKNIEKKTAGYIVGSVAIDGYDERYDVHVYVDAFGQMVAYYLNSEPASKIIDWVGYATSHVVTGSKLEIALTLVCDAMGVSLTEVRYYDFRYPEATSVKIIADEETTSGVTETFRVMIPDNHMVYNKTWSHGCYISRSSCELQIDSVSLNINDHGVTYENWNIYEGDIPLSLLISGAFHEVQLVHWDNTSSGTSYAGIVLIYSETP